MQPAIRDSQTAAWTSPRWTPALRIPTARTISIPSDAGIVIRKWNGEAVFASTDALETSIRRAFAGTLSQPTWSMVSRFRSRREPAPTTFDAPRKRSAVSSKRWRPGLLQPTDLLQPGDTQEIRAGRTLPSLREGRRRGTSPWERGAAAMIDISPPNQPSPCELAEARRFVTPPTSGESWAAKLSKGGGN